jgi:hypothetical protein
MEKTTKHWKMENCYTEKLEIELSKKGEILKKIRQNDENQNRQLFRIIILPS